MKLKRHDAAELERFLVAIDDALDTAASIVVIGGCALALGYGVAAATNDIDTYGSRLGAIEIAARRARILTRLDIPIANSTIAQLPEGYETRLRRVIPRLRQLAVWVVEAHDLAASKLLRGNEHDRQQLLQLHQAVGLDLDTLVERCLGLIADHVGNPAEPRWSLFHFVEEVWGEIAALDLRPG